MFDAADPHRQARFWAEALGYVVEDNSKLIAKLLDDGAITTTDLVDVDGAEVFRTAAAVRDPDGPFDEFTGIGQGGRVLFQIVPEPKVAKNRVHLDLRAGDRRDEVVERLVSLGASVIGEGSQGPSTWKVLADPEGNEFCVA